MWQPIVNPISYKRNHSTMKTNNIKPNYSELARLHSCDRRTVKKYDNGYDGKPTTRDKESKLDKYKEKIKSKFTEVTKLNETTRGEGGFGSSGK